MTTGGESLEQLRAEARYRRGRLAVYRARVYALRATSSSKLRELERASEGAAERLRRAECAHSQDSAPGSD